MGENNLISILISSVSFVVSVVALYFSQLRRAKIDIIAGELLNINHFAEGNCGITLAVSIANRGAIPTTVRRLGLLVQKPGSKEGYLMEPLYYQKIDQAGNFLHDTPPGPIAVAGGKSETRQVLFRSSFERPDEFTFTRPGEYNFTVLAWIKESVEPQAGDSFLVELSEQSAAQLDQWRKEKNTMTERVRRFEWKKWEAHKLTEVEVAALNRPN